MRRDSRADCVVRVEGRLAMTWYEKFLKEREEQERADEEQWYSQEDELEIRKVEALERIADALEGLRAATWIK